ncbi:MAG: NAD(P)H-hydrate dehydratase [Thermoguttaceae bacterium]|nr:NAD(P)H-hydrate dehydratase [Thermoguttaceae bacterium]
MEPFLPVPAYRRGWRKLAELERIGRRVKFWRDLPDLPERPEDGHKGTFGTGVLIGGSRGMSGAIALAGSACLFAGAGLTRLRVPDPILETVASFQREYTIGGYPADAEGRLAYSESLVSSALEGATAVGIGPGLGRSEDLNRLSRELFSTIPVPAVFDADALNALGSEFEYEFPVASRILTPHPGEFARLFGRKPTDDPKDRLDCARAFLRRVKSKAGGAFPSEFVLVLKGAESVVAKLDGASGSIRTSVNRTGCEIMATGGSGDVLTGVIVGLLAQGASPWDAARLGTALCGLAGELRRAVCSRGGVASDIIRFLPIAFDYFEDAKFAVLSR